ncbi:MAG: SOS response-associated peptidase [Aquaticitalea sp.]
MCYDIKVGLETQLRRAILRGDRAAEEEIRERLIPLTDLPIHHATGFSHPELLIYTDRSPDFPEVATWGLVPPWVRDEEQLKKSWNNTLNARGETIFEKNSFRASAKNSRCLIYVDGFYEHHHFKKNTYPFYIYRKNKEPMILAGLYNEWKNPESHGVMNTFSIVTTTGNPLLAKIHNNPKLEGPRMPLILPEELADNWLMDYTDELDQKALEELIQEYPTEELASHTVHQIRGKNGTGNVEAASDVYEYPELEGV